MEQVLPAKRIMTQHKLTRTLRRLFRINEEGLVIVDNIDTNGQFEFHWQLSDTEWIHLVTTATSEYIAEFNYDKILVCIGEWQYIGVASKNGGCELQIDGINKSKFHEELNAALQKTHDNTYNPFDGRADYYVIAD